MTLGENIENIIKELEEGKRVKEFYTTSADQHSKEYEAILPKESALIFLNSHLESFNKYGNSEGSDPKGYWIRIVRFELVD